MQQKLPETDDNVKLKPILGIRPGIYLAVLYSIALLCVLFFILVFPGLKNPGAVIVLKTEPAGAALRVDGTYMGTSPDKVFISKGLHSMEIILPGFEPIRADKVIPGRTFGSLFFPIRYPLEFTLKTNDPYAAFALSAADYAAWSFGGEPTATWQIPLSLSEGAYRAGGNIRSAAESQDAAQDAALTNIDELLKAFSQFAVTRAALRDLLRAKFILDNGGLSPSPASMFNSVSGMLLFLSENPGSAAWLAGLLPPESASIVKASNWHKNEISAAAKQLPEPYADRDAIRRFELAGLGFISIPAGLNQKSFMISETAVYRDLFESFLDENQEWKEENLLTLAEMSYLTARRDEVTEVSWFAAVAFCEWLTKKLPLSMPNQEVRLPTEAEWEYASKNFKSRYGMAYQAKNLASLEDNGWEWCAGPYTHLPFIKASAKALQIAGSPERAIRRAFGAPAVLENRGSLPPEFSSPFVSFRPVIAEKIMEN